MTAPGMNHFTSGLLHPWMTPTHLIILLALGLWLGQNVPLRLGLPLKVFAPLSAAALAFTTTGWIAGVPPAHPGRHRPRGGSSRGARSPSPHPPPAPCCSPAAAVAIGLDSGAETGTPFAIAGTLLGTWVSLSLGLVNIAYYVSLAAERKKKWISIGLRIAGSWIVAISLLMLAFSLRRAHREDGSKDRTSNTQHPTSNIQSQNTPPHSLAPLDVGRWMLDVLSFHRPLQLRRALNRT